MAKPIGDLTARGPLAHNPHIIAAESRGEARGRAAVLAERVCGNCQHWAGDEAWTANGWDAACNKLSDIRNFLTIYVQGDGYVDSVDFDTPATFSCGFFEVRAHAAGVAAHEER
jgi:hypothetical protein